MDRVMAQLASGWAPSAATAARAAAIFHEQRQIILERTDRMFAGLMVFQWLFGIVLALLVSPRTWAGQFSQTHWHVWVALFLGGAVLGFPILLALTQPGKALTRHAIAIGQMLDSSLLIHLTGGRIETHFHIFGSLAFLAFYRDWRVLISATIIVYVDHFLRGVYWPQSVYGVLTASPWRAVEHAGWVIFEVLFLIKYINESLQEMSNVAQRQARLEAVNEVIEQEVVERTAEAEQRAQQLARSNAELEQFAYVASHDLQEPLRMVTSYCQLLERRYKGKLDAGADKYIAYAVDGANRMQVLINDLLTYSRVGKKGGPFEPTDCSAAADQAIANLQAAIQESGAVVTRDVLPNAPADGQQLTQVFQNLIGNAIKFRKPEEPPRVHIAVAPNGNDWIFSVRDNGIGIAPEHGARIFQIFQRLHGRGEYPGTGIGLAICKKGVEHHGGRIWVESQPGRGSEFFFTIPRGGDQQL
jgi:signal transduction histidine kinase